MKYIDFHVHTFPDEIAEKALKRLIGFSGLQPVTDGTVSGTIAQMSDMNIDMFVNLNIATSPHQQKRINDTAARLNEEHFTCQNRHMLSFGSVHPDAPDVLDELLRVKSLGLLGVKFHPDYQEFMIDQERMNPIYDLCSQLGLIVVFHAGWDCYSPNYIHATPDRSAKVAKAFPHLKMVLAHLGGLKLWDDVEEHIAGLENVYMDTAMVHTMGLAPEQFKRILARHPKENILLGSDCPWESTRDSIAYIERMNLSSDVTAKILAENALSLLGSIDNHG